MPIPTPSRRPDLTADLSPEEFSRWYWLRDELAEFARSLGLRAAGGKQQIAARIVAHLSGVVAPPEPVLLRSSTPQLAGPLDEQTVIPAGQRSSQVLRAWFAEQVGPSFAFDGPLRAFISDGDGTATLGDALEFYRTTRGRGPEHISAQFELNRFSRAWHAAHPEGDRRSMLDDRARYRNTPADERHDAGLPSLAL